MHTHSQYIQAHFFVAENIKCTHLSFSVSSALSRKTKSNFSAVVFIQQPWRIYTSGPTFSLLHVCLPFHFATAFNRLCFPGGIALFHTPFTRNGSSMMMHFGSSMLYKNMVPIYLIMMDRWELQNLNDEQTLHCSQLCRYQYNRCFL